MKYWEIIADNLSKARWSWGWVSAIDSNGRTIFVADAHRDDGKRFVAHADEKLTAFVELEAAISTGASGWLHRLVRRHSAQLHSLVRADCRRDQQTPPARFPFRQIDSRRVELP